MPMIDVYAAANLFPADADRRLAEELTAALLKAEGVVNPGPTHTHNTGAYIHRLPPSAVNTAAQGNARTVRVQVVTPPGVLSREGQKQLVAEARRRSSQDRGRPEPGDQNLGAPDGSGGRRVGKSPARHSGARSSPPRSPRRRSSCAARSFGRPLRQ